MGTGSPVRLPRAIRLAARNRAKRYAKPRNSPPLPRPRAEVRCRYTRAIRKLRRHCSALAHAMQNCRPTKEPAMKTKTWIRGVTIGIVSVMALLVPSPTFAGKNKSAELGVMSVAGTSYSGGTNLYYQLNLTAFAPGAVSAQAAIKAKGWSAVFDPLAAVVSSGTSTISSASIQVPANITGKAKLKVKVQFNGGKLGKKTLVLLITAPPPVVTSETVSPTAYDVGFGNPVTLDANVVSTNGLVEPLSYFWTITDTDIRTNALINDATA